MAVASRPGTFAEYAALSLGHWRLHDGLALLVFLVITVGVETSLGRPCCNIGRGADLADRPGADRGDDGDQLAFGANYGEFEFWFASLKVGAIAASSSLGWLHLRLRSWTGRGDPSVDRSRRIFPQGLGAPLAAIPW